MQNSKVSAMDGINGRDSLQMMGQQELWRIAHGAAPFRSPMYERAEVVATSARGR